MKQRIARLLRKAANRMDPPKPRKVGAMNINVSANTVSMARSAEVLSQARVALAERDLYRARRAAQGRAAGASQ